MRPEHLKLASIVTMVCGAMSSLGAGAASSESPTIATGRIIPMRNPALDAASNMTDGVAQDTALVTSGDAPDVVVQADDAGVAPVPEAAPVAQGSAVPDVVYTARTAVLSTLDVAPVTSALPDAVRVPDVSVASAQDDAPVMGAVPYAVRAPDVSVASAQDDAPVMGAVPDAVRVPDVSVASAQNDAPVTSAVSDAVHVPHVLVVSTQDVAPAMGAVPKFASMPDMPVASTQDVAPVTSAVPDSVLVPKVPAVSAQDVALATNAVPDAARMPTVSVKVVVPVMSAVPVSAQVAEAQATSAQHAARAESTASDAVGVADIPVVSAAGLAPITGSVAPGAAVPGPDTQVVASAKNVAREAPGASPHVAQTVSPMVAPAKIAMPAMANAKPDVVRPMGVAATPSASDGLLARAAALNLKVSMDVPVQSAQRAPSAATGQKVEATTDGKPARAAQKHDDADAWASADLVAVDESRLDNMRGGFDLPSGLVVSFGISRVAFVNGNLVSSTSFNIPNVAQMTPQQAQMLASANSGALVQNGLNNTVQPGALPGVTGAVIQNTLSNQQIQALTTINTSVNSLAAFKAMNIGTTLNSALAAAVRPR
ncbi:hypothetical protein [Paraburkholderia sp. BL10I2N1]|uniref:hypothetical protein n=1 Tax=Paraburkholderia sp. BL10I2N1 TaxID=1938796 RepID=UPI0010DF90A9|nr:hypothetical protein [Paraburkholderia sp. BL10I2N1]TDN63718.1 hypothetical protein B0G77_7398 [Paraburkholderia sp. BL10I2N1]